MTHGTASLPAVFIVAAAVVPFCSCWVYQKPSCWVGTQAAHTCISYPVGILPPLPFSPCTHGPSKVGKPPRTLTCHGLAERSVQTLSFHSALVQRQLQTLPAHAGLNLPAVSCRMRSWRAYSPVGLCQHCAFSSRPLLPLRCLPCCIYNFLIRLNKSKDSCLLFSHGLGSGGKPLTRCFPQEGAGAGLRLCFSPFGKFRHLSQLVSPLLVQTWERVAMPLLKM